VLRRQLGGRRLRLTDDERRKLAARASRLGPSRPLIVPLKPPLCGGRRWWAHLAFSPMNIELTIVKKEFEETPRPQTSVGYV
jgi:hypothetical protein